LDIFGNGPVRKRPECNFSILERGHQNIEYGIYNLEYRRTNPQPSPPTFLIHTHIHQRNPAGLLVHLQRQYNPTGLPVRSHGCTCNNTGLPAHSQGCTLTQNPNQDALFHLSPLFLFYISYKRQHGSACVLARCGVQSSGILVAVWPTCVVLSRYVSIPVSAGPVWSSLAQDLHVSGRHERGIRTVPLPGTLACAVPR